MFEIPVIPLTFKVNAAVSTMANITLLGIEKEVSFTSTPQTIEGETNHEISFQFQHNQANAYDITLTVTCLQLASGEIMQLTATGNMNCYFAGAWATTFGHVAADAISFNPAIKIDCTLPLGTTVDLAGQIQFDDVTHKVESLELIHATDFDVLYQQIQHALQVDAISYLLPYTFIPQKAIEETNRFQQVYEEKGVFTTENIQSKGSFLTEIIPSRAEKLLQRLIDKPYTRTEDRLKALNFLKWVSYVKKGLITPFSPITSIIELSYGLYNDGERDYVMEACKSLSQPTVDVLHYLFTNNYANDFETLRDELMEFEYVATIEEANEAVETYLNSDLLMRITRKTISCTSSVHDELYRSDYVTKEDRILMLSKCNPYVKIMVKMLQKANYSLSIIDTFLKNDCQLELFARIELLRAAHFPLNELVDLLLADATSTEDILFFVKRAKYNLMDIGITLKFQLKINDPAAALARLKDLGYDFISCAIILKMVYKMGPTKTSKLLMEHDVATILRFVFELPSSKATTILAKIGYTENEIEEQLQAEYDSNRNLATDRLSIAYTNSINCDTLVGINTTEYLELMDDYSTWHYKHSKYKEQLITWERTTNFTPGNTTVIGKLQTSIQEIVQESQHLLEHIRYAPSVGIARAIVPETSAVNFVSFSASKNAYVNTATKRKYADHALSPIKVEEELIAYLINDRSDEVVRLKRLGVKYTLNSPTTDADIEPVLELITSLRSFKSTAIHEVISFFKTTKNLSVTKALTALKNTNNESVAIGDILYNIYEIYDASEAVRLLRNVGYFTIDITIILHKVYKTDIFTTIELLQQWGN